MEVMEGYALQIEVPNQHLLKHVEEFPLNQGAFRGKHEKCHELGLDFYHAWDCKIRSLYLLMSVASCLILAA